MKNDYKKENALFRFSIKLVEILSEVYFVDLIMVMIVSGIVTYMLQDESIILRLVLCVMSGLVTAIWLSLGRIVKNAKLNRKTYDKLTKKFLLKILTNALNKRMGRYIYLASYKGSVQLNSETGEPIVVISLLNGDVTNTVDGIYNRFIDNEFGTGIYSMQLLIKDMDRVCKLIEEYEYGYSILEFNEISRDKFIDKLKRSMYTKTELTDDHYITRYVFNPNIGTEQEKYAYLIILTDDRVYRNGILSKYKGTVVSDELLYNILVQYSDADSIIRLE